MIISFILLILFIIQLGNVKQNPNSQKFESENISKETSNISQKTKIATLNTDVFKVAKNNKVKSNKIISNKVTNISNLKFNEILVLDYFKNKTTTKEAPISKLNDFGKNYKQTLDKLISMNYLQLANIVDEIKYFTIPVLKNILKTKSLNISGNKNTLLERILNNFSEQELLKYINE
nr:MAG TPA: Protein inhibitor of activated STAT helix bundle, RIKEN Structural [Caudoviricetes sp.]